MKPEIRKIVTRSALFFGILAVSAAGMQLEGEPLGVSDCAALIARELSTKRSQI